MKSTIQNDVRVTVIIASYNHAAYIEKSIRSVLDQTYSNIELLVVDDGSTDDSVAVIRRLQAEYGFDFRSQENQGLTNTLNVAIARSTGSLLVSFGSDDVMHPERIAKQVEYLRDKPEVGICAGNYELINGKGELYPEKRQRRNRPFRRLTFEDLFLSRYPFPSAATMMIRREVFEQVGGFDPEIPLEDLLITLKITSAGYFVDVLDCVLAQYRQHPTNTHKNYRFMVQNILRTYALFDKHPQHDAVKYRFLNSMFLKTSNRDRALARELLAQLPFKAWGGKTLRGLGRLYFGSSARR